MTVYALLYALHVLAAVVWVGGMFFAWMVLRPAAVTALEPPARLRLWSAVFRDSSCSYGFACCCCR